MTNAFCAKCNRHLIVSEEDSLTCPVCSSPLIDTSAVTGGAAAASRQGGWVGSEDYLG
jgi:Zn finger protein HypA/HybF involved in hydrogenase expression